jgi:5-methylcytosine-specific restriction endonuclease McrA
MMFAMVLVFVCALVTEGPRSHGVRTAFQREHVCPSTGLARGACPGWVIDHIVPLACGGKDAVSNMQWQTKNDAKEKDKWERRGCSTKHTNLTTNGSSDSER